MKDVPELFEAAKKAGLVVLDEETGFRYFRKIGPGDKDFAEYYMSKIGEFYVETAVFDPKDDTRIVASLNPHSRVVEQVLLYQGGICDKVEVRSCSVHGRRYKPDNLFDEETPRQVLSGPETLLVYNIGYQTFQNVVDALGIEELLGMPVNVRHYKEGNQDDNTI